MNTPTTATASARTEASPPSASTRATLHAREHSACFACGTVAESGLGLNFALAPVGDEVFADWLPPRWAISYENTVHGGLIATVLDSAMVHALFARDLLGRTADLRIRYRQAVQPSLPCSLRARLVDRRGPLCQLEASLHQAGRLCARASATFMIPPRSQFLP
jgi:hypothetical protein